MVSAITIPFSSSPTICQPLCQIILKWSEVAQLCQTLWDPVDCSLPGCSVHGILQARILEWIAISFPRGSSQPRDQTRVSHIAGRCFTLWATKETQPNNISPPYCIPGSLSHFLCKSDLDYMYISHLLYALTLPSQTLNSVSSIELRSILL